MFSCPSSDGIVGGDEGGSHGEDGSDWGALESHVVTEVAEGYVLVSGPVFAVRVAVNAQVGDLLHGSIRRIGGGDIGSDPTTGQVKGIVSTVGLYARSVLVALGLSWLLSVAEVHGIVGSFASFSIHHGLVAISRGNAGSLTADLECTCAELLTALKSKLGITS